jgi:integrase
MDAPMNSITPEDLADRYKSIKESVEKGKFRKKYKGDVFVNEPGIAAANGALRVIRAVWSFAAIRCPGIPSWPKGWFTEATVYKLNPRKRHLKPEKNGDLERFYNAVNKTNEAGEYVIGRTARDAILLLLFTGMRFRECVELTWARIDFKAKKIHFDAEHRKENKEMDLPMSDFVFGILKSREGDGKDGPFVFPGWGASGHLERLNAAFVTIQGDCGIRMNPHALRHSYISVAEESGIGGFKARALVGHGGQDVHDDYTHVDLAVAAQKVADKLKEFCIPPLSVIGESKKAS